MRPRRSLGAAFLLAGWLTACDNTATYKFQYPSATDIARVVVVPEGGKMPAVGRANLVYLEGATPPRDGSKSGYPDPDKVRLGAFVGPWNPAAIAWIDEATVSICPLADDRSTPAMAAVLVTKTTRRTFRVTTVCPDFLRKAVGPAHLPKGP